MMKIVEMPDYVEFDHDDLQDLLLEAVSKATGREVIKAEIFVGQTRGGPNRVYAKVFLKNAKVVGEKS